MNNSHIIFTIILIISAILYFSEEHSVKQGDIKQRTSNIEDKPTQEVISESKDAPKMKNVLLISLDTLRADHMSLYGYPKDTTPFIDDLGKESTVYERCYSQNGWTLPSHMSILTGLYPQNHGVTDTMDRLSDEIPTLASILVENGYATTAFTGGGYVGERHNYHGFQEFTSINHREFEFAKKWLSENRSEPFFIFVHSYFPHMDYFPPPDFDIFSDREYPGPIRTARGSDDEICGFYKDEYRNYQCKRKNLFYYLLFRENMSEKDREYISARYDGEILHVDWQVKLLVESLFSAYGKNDTLIIITSDHGEKMFDYDDHKNEEIFEYRFGLDMDHGGLHDKELQVPLIIYDPSSNDGERLPQVVESIDITPTILKMLGIQEDIEFDGEALPTSIESNTDEIAFSQELREDWTSLIWGDKQLINYPFQKRSFLVRIKSGEKAIRVDEKQYPKLRQSMQEMINAKIREKRDFKKSEERVELDDETRQSLINLGYFT